MNKKNFFDNLESNFKIIKINSESVAKDRFIEYEEVIQFEGLLFKDEIEGFGIKILKINKEYPVSIDGVFEVKRKWRDYVSPKLG